MILDVSTYVGHWPFRPLHATTLEQIAAIAEHAGVTHIITSHLHGAFYQDCQKANEELYEEVKAYAGGVNVLPFAVINPTYIGWEKDCNICLEQFGFQGVEIMPHYHHYAWDDPTLVSFYAYCGERNIPVRINNSFENTRQRNLHDYPLECTSEIPKLLLTGKKTLTIVTQVIPATIRNMGTLFGEHDHVYFDISRISFMTSGPFLSKLNGIPLQRYCFGSLNPFAYVECALNRVYYAEITEHEKEGLLFGELAAKLGL
ncbi:MAG TPA: hypothetical protein DCY74_07150 [Clostridiales bacterium]|jgi:predicted TIM-barrel fold metal-dependent hydrolase|nr:hypothetical protein [Clostridiales bacterium]HBE13931.1 hypothetical protein [Clostridiales bacterium]HCG35724.1 hypothetical protein [Clostridiales bacterium]